MAGIIQFNRDYAAFGGQVKPHEKSDDVGSVISWILGEWPDLYPVGALINAKISGIWLGEGERPAADIDNLDLIFKMAKPGEGFFEIVLRSEGNAPVYGGWASGESLEVTEEIVNGHRVLIATQGADKIRYEYTFDTDYGSIYAWAGPVAGSRASTATVRKSARKSPR